MIFNIIGLVFDLIGVLLLFKFGILPDNLWEHLLMDNGMSEKDEKKHKFWSKFAIFFLLLGFIFQIAGSTIQKEEESKVKVVKTQFENINLGNDINESIKISGNLKLKYENNKVYYQLKIAGIKSFDNIYDFGIELIDKDGFKISEIKIQSENQNINQLIKNDSIFLDIKGDKPFLAKNYSQINKWDLIVYRK